MYCPQKYDLLFYVIALINISVYTPYQFEGQGVILEQEECSTTPIRIKKVNGEFDAQNPKKTHFLEAAKR